VKNAPQHGNPDGWRVPEDSFLHPSGNEWPKGCAHHARGKLNKDRRNQVRGDPMLEGRVNKGLVIGVAKRLRDIKFGQIKIPAAYGDSRAGSGDAAVAIELPVDRVGVSGARCAAACRAAVPDDAEQDKCSVSAAARLHVLLMSTFLSKR
jgi:hypothetical protein